MGGARMAEAGMDVVADPTAHAVVGTSEAIGRLPALYRAYRDLVSELRARRPRALVLIDFPEFNMRLGRQARRAGVPVVYFIPPQVWAWRRGRLRSIARLVSQVLAVFPFERGLYEEAGVPVEFVGHPLLDVVPRGLDRPEARRRLGLTGEARVVGLFPGSRKEEVTRLMPVMLDAARRLHSGGRDLCFLLGRAPSVNPGMLDTLLAEAGSGAPRVTVLDQRSHDIMAAADAVLIASGTATLEAALLGAPMVVCYRVSRLSELAARLLLRIPWISLPNIVAGQAVVPEIVQDDVTGERLARELARLLDDAEAAGAQRAAFAQIMSRLGEPGVGRRAAVAVLRAARAA
jgi:lipid-A-disaccharide synthase